jgi:hypothetical protein
MPTLTFFPLGNADSCLIDLASGEKLLLDYGHQGNPEDDNDLRCDLPALLRKDLKKAKRDFFDVVAFSHLDKDHYERATEFFYLEHAQRYQSEDRIKIKTLWVPAAVITEEGVEDPEGKVIRAEARYRLKTGKGIRVFSRPERLREWLQANGLSLEERKHLITDAGQLVPGFTIPEHGVEFFVHSPFAKRLNETQVEDRNDDSLVLHMTFLCGTTATKVFFAADVTHEILADIVTVTQAKGNAERLEWDVVKLPHHCSYLSLGPDRGEDRTTPVPDVARLYEEQAQERGIIVSTSNPIPEKGSDEDKKSEPPHRQAAAYYREVTEKLDGEFKVTMEHPKKSAPAPLIIEIGSAKATIRKEQFVGAAAIVSQVAPRAGRP